MTLAPPARVVEPRWYFIPIRVLLVTFLVTLLSFAVSLLLGIGGLALAGWRHHAQPNLSLAYRHVALPAALIAAGVTLMVVSVLEIRNYRQARVLVRIARSAQSQG